MSLELLEAAPLHQALLRQPQWLCSAQQRQLYKDHHMSEDTYKLLRTFRRDVCMLGRRCPQLLGGGVDGDQGRAGDGQVAKLQHGNARTSTCET